MSKSSRDAVGPIYLLELASSQARWLEMRQATIASNVANVNTPGFRALDVTPFVPVRERDAAALVTTSPRHFSAGEVGADVQRTRKSESWDVVHSGNSVNLEQEMLKAGDVNRDYSLNTAVVKAFQRMFTMSIKG
jgi:flagellar basal-body rod protein FlgB